MPPEPSPWDRKDFFKERKQEKSSESVGFVSRWRETPHHGSSSREFARWGSADFRSRTPGHVKQGGWHNYSEESGHGFTPSRSSEKILDDESSRPSGSRVDGKYSRNSRDNRGSFSHKDWKGHAWENGVSPNGPGRPHDVNDQRSVNEMLMYNSHSHCDLVNTWDQFHLKDQHDKTRSFVGSGTGQRFERENSLGSIDWKPLKWTRSGSLSSRGSGFSHSSSSKSLGVDSIEAKAEVQLRNVTPIQSPSGDAVVCAISTTPSEETNSRKKPRLKWGEGLAKYEKKKVEGPDDGETKNGTVICGNTEALHLQVSNLSDKSPRVTGFSDCASPATPSSVACSSSPGIDDKPSVKVASIDNDTINLSGSPRLSSQNDVEGVTLNLENLELAAIANLSSSIGELLQSDNPGSVDFSYVRSTAMNKLLAWKGGILKALEMTESEIDTLENELKSLISESGNSHSCAAGSSSLEGEHQAKPCGELVSGNVITRPAPLQVVSSGDLIVEKAVGGLEEEHGQVKDEDLDSPGTVTSKFVEPLSEAKTAAPSDVVAHDESSGDLDARESKNQEKKCSENCFNAEKIEGLSNFNDCGPLTARKSYVDTPVRVNLYSEMEEELYDMIVASNRDSANRASEVFNKLLSSDQGHIDVLKTRLSSWHNDPRIKEKFAMRKRFLRFKERAIILKFRAFQHLWKEDMRLLSMRKYRAKSQKRLELGSRTLHGSYQKHRSSIRSRFATPAGNLSLVPTTEIINFTGKLLSDSQVKHCRNSLKMPAMILDKKEKMISRFISNNGLVEYPCAIERERAMINPWTTEERGIFMDKLATFGKDFRKIASFLDHKTTADCVEFYYKNHKSDCFVKTKKSEFAKEGKSCSTSNYLVTSGKRWNREANAASLDMLGAASAIAANADDGVAIQQRCRARFLMGATSDYRVPRGDGVLERSGSVDIFSNERETVAADVLAGICGSLSSEAMSSCITSSFDPGESYQDWKCQKVGSLKRRPLTPEVTQNVDDETCSDESCGEMDPTDWTDEEKSIFIHAVSSYGKDFTMISRCVRTRSRDQCKVFFSKARKCLGLDMIQPRPVNEGMPTSDDAPGGGSDNEDACVVETGSVSCSEKRGSKIDEDMMLSDLNINHFEYDPAESMNIQTDLNLSKENSDTGRMGGKDAGLQSEDMVTGDWREEANPQLDLDGDGKMKNGFGGMSGSAQDHENAVLPLDDEAGGDEEPTGPSLGESLLVKGANEPGLSVSGAEGKTITIGQEQQGQQLVTGNNVSDKQEGNGDAEESAQAVLNYPEQDLHTNSRVSDLAADTNAPVGFGVDPKQKEKIAMEFDPPPEPCVPCVVSLQQDASLVNVNSLIKGPQPSQHVKPPSPDVAATIDFEKISDEHCQTSAGADDCKQHQSGRSGFGQTGAGQILKGYPLQVSTEEEMNGDVGSKKLASLQSFSKVDRNSCSDMYLSKECLLQKCNGSKGSLAVELPFLSQEQKSDYSRPPSWSSIDAEKPSRNGDVKLFGQILTHPSAQQKPNACVVHENEDKGLPHPKLSSKNLNLKFSGIQSVDGNSVPAKLDRNNYLGIENVPLRSYGYWDGNRIQTGFSSLPDSAILLAKYPAAFGNYSTSSSTMEQQPLRSLVKSNEHNFNGSSVFSNREMSSSNGVADHLFYRNREGGGRVPQFTVDMKQRQDMLFSEMQMRNGFDGASGMQQQGRMVGLNVVGRGGILVGGACTGVSDPVAAIKMHYAKTEQFGGGQTASIIREEESWRGKGDIGR